MYAWIVCRYTYTHMLTYVYVSMRASALTTLCLESVCLSVCLSHLGSSPLPRRKRATLHVPRIRYHSRNVITCGLLAWPSTNVHDLSMHNTSPALGMASIHTRYGNRHHVSRVMHAYRSLLCAHGISARNVRMNQVELVCCLHAHDMWARNGMHTHGEESPS